MNASLESVRAGWLLREPGVRLAERDAHLLIADGRIEDVRLGEQHETRAELGGSHLLAMPTLVDAHDHGMGLPSIAHGARDQPLELWLAATRLRPAIDPYLVTALAFARLARSGVGAVVDCHYFSGSRSSWVGEAAQVCQAAKDVGIRLAFAVPLRDRGDLAYTEDQTLLELLSEEDREAVRTTFARPVVPIDEQMQLVDEVDARCAGRTVDVQYGPTGPQWCSDHLLERIAAASARHDRRVHMHLLETRQQREWADATYRRGLVRHLDDIGLLTPRLTVSHGVWLRPDEWELLAERGVTVVVNTSSNLRLRSGIAPLNDFVRGGVSVALGVDGLSLDDDGDALRELRLTHLLHAGVGMDGGVSKKDLFTASMRVGARSVHGSSKAGVLDPGYPADVLLLNFEALAADVIHQSVCDEADLVLARASADFVEAVIVDGGVIVKDYQVLGVDEKSIAHEVAERARSAGEEVVARMGLLQRYQQALTDLFTMNLHTK